MIIGPTNVSAVLEWFYEPFNRRPHDVFVLTLGSRRLVGRHRSPASARDQRRTCLITAPMILGELQREHVQPRGVLVFYRPLSDGDSEELFGRCASDPQTDLYYPFATFDPTGHEWCTPATFWATTSERVEELNADEASLRAYVITHLQSFDLEGKTLFDPACSTGEFLASLKRAYPTVRTVGQDLSPEMVALCRGRLDEVHCGDARQPVLPEESADFVFCRFLNFHVVTIAQAHELLRVNALRCRIGGFLLIVGYTPVLVSAEWCQILGLEVLQRTAFCEDRRALFQYYWLRRVGAVAKRSPWEQASFLTQD